MIRIGRVEKSEDATMAGVIEITPLDDKTSAEPIVAVPCSPNLGGGAGFISVPTPGTLVLFVDLGAYAKSFSDNPLVRYAWIGALGQNLPQEKGRSPLPNDKNVPEDYDAQQRDSLGRAPGEAEVLMDGGLPDAHLIYGDNGIPQADIWKQRNGHKIIMAHKVTKEGTYDTGITVEAKSGKRIHIDDQPSPFGIGGGDRITIIDDKVGNDLKANRFEIISSRDEAELVTDKTQTHTTNRGSQHHTIMNGRGDQRRDNEGAGDIIDIAHGGNHISKAEVDISRVSYKGDINEVCNEGDIKYEAVSGEITIEAASKITLLVGGSTVVVDGNGVTVNGSNVGITGATGDVVVNGISLVTHKHISPFFGIPTSPSIP